MDSSKYSHKVDKIELIETHISIVALTGTYAYKCMKPVEFGEILNFKKLETRQQNCRAEIKLNKRFSAELYLDVVSLQPDKISNELDKNFEFAVKMKQIPQKYIFENILEQGKKLNDELLERLAKELSEFYLSTKTKSEGGNLNRIREKIDENFRTLEKLNSVDYEYKNAVFDFFNSNKLAFEQRRENGWIKDGHGDLQPKNIFILPNKIYIFDCITFNKLLRYVDVAEDIAFLAMELDRFGLREKSKYLIDKFVLYIGDPDLMEVLNFYKSYRATVRRKVALFRCSEIDNKQSAEVKKLKKEAKEYHELAREYMGL